MIAIHFEAQKGKFSNLVFAPGPTTSGGFIEVNNCLIWCSIAHKVAGSTFVLPSLQNWSTVQCNFEVGQNFFWHKYLPLQNEQVHPITESSKNKSWVAHAGSLCHCECSLEMLMVHGTVWSWREVEAEARGCRGWGPETLRAPWRLALTSVMESCKDWSFKNMTQFLKKKSKSNFTCRI